ncbi:hypothetical protein KI387_038793, partial [Taxus chinensis]
PLSSFLEDPSSPILKGYGRIIYVYLGLFFSTSSANNIQVNSRSTQLLRREYSNSNPETSSETAPVLGSELAQLPLIADEIRQSPPVVPYKTPANITHVVECAVCLCKFEEGDQIRELPCSLFFHRNCLEKWLDHQQTTCPLCRFSLIPEETAFRLRRREQELTEELMFWFSSFHGHGLHSMWWLRANLERCSEDFGSTSEKPRDAWQQSLGRGDRVSPEDQRGNDNQVSMRPDRTKGRDAHFRLYN